MRPRGSMKSGPALAERNEYMAPALVSVCLSGQDKLLRLLTPASHGTYRLYMTNTRFKTCGFH